MATVRLAVRAVARQVMICPSRVRANNTRHLSSRPDPFARRPTAKCDPYGQGGKPLTLAEAKGLLATVEPEWKLWNNQDGDITTNDEDSSTPFAIARDFWHQDYMQGAKFVTHVAAVAQMNDHYPHQVVLDRYLSSREKAWKIRTRVVCRTFVLQGLSHHDFFLATLLDVETTRPEVAGLLVK